MKYLTIAATALALSAGAASAATIVQQSLGAQDSNPVSDSQSGSLFPQFAYDNFVVSSDTTLTSVSWNGAYVFGDGVPNGDDFTITLFNDTGLSGTAALGSQFFSENVGSNVNATDTGSQTLSDDLFSYTTNLSSGVSLTAGTYWLSIVNNTSDDDAWAWTSAFNVSGGFSLQSSPTPGGTPPLGTANLVTNNERVFTLESGSTVAPVPLPAGFPLLAAGLIGLGALARRKKSA